VRDDQLTELLREADADWKPDVGDLRQLAGEVRRRLIARRRRRRTLSGLGALAMLVAATSVWRVSQSVERVEVDPLALARQQDVQPTGEPGSGVSTNIARLRAEAEFHTRLAHDLMAINARERERRLRQRTFKQDTSLESLDVVAYRMILRADAILASMQSSEEAATIYRQVVRLFPTTGSAELAKERLMKAGFSAEDI
jgi:hypothetical protein